MLEKKYIVDQIQSQERFLSPEPHQVEQEVLLLIPVRSASK